MRPRRDFAGIVYPALLSALVIGAVGVVALVAREPWLFPSLGPTIFLHMVNPGEPAARSRNTLLGHGVGALAGFAALFLAGAQDAPSAFSADGLVASRVVATALAIGGTIFFQKLLDAGHPPAAATTMLITLGGMKPELRFVLAIAIGVALTTALGFVARAVSSWRLAANRAPQAPTKKQPDLEPGC
jgi:hypothetical protein